MIEGLETANRIFKTVDLGIRRHDAKISNHNFSDMMEFSPQALDALNRSGQIYEDMQAELEPLKNLVSDALKEQYGLDSDRQEGVQEMAQDLLNGYFSAENTSDRIFGFAFSFFDGSSDRTAFAEDMRSAIDKGFAQAEKMLGGLADISYETRDLIDRRIDDFVAEGSESPDQVEVTA